MVAVLSSTSSQDDFVNMKSDVFDKLESFESYLKFNLLEILTKPKIRIKRKFISLFMIIYYIKNVQSIYE
jgi:hypothetical protein